MSILALFKDLLTHFYRMVTSPTASAPDARQSQTPARAVPCNLIFFETHPRQLLRLLEQLSAPIDVNSVTVPSCAGSSQFRLFFRRPLKKPFLMAYHCRARLVWAQHRQPWRLRDFRRVLFTGELRVCADPNGGRIRIWQHIRGTHEERSIRERDRWQGVWCMVWGGMGHNVMLGPVFFNFNDGNPGKVVTAQRYVY